jgi:phosphate-selective porin OprO and OprP
VNIKLKGAFIVLFSLFTIGATQAQTINKSKFGKGLQFIAADSSFSMKFQTRFQMLYVGGSNPTDNEWDDQFLIRRARLKFGGFVYDPRLTYKIELGLSNRDIGGEPIAQQNFANNIILDAVAKWEFMPGWELWVGQTKLPGNRERVISSQQLQFVDRSLLNSRFNIDRDAGLQLHHEHNLGNVVLRQAAAISNGEGRDYTALNAGGYSYTLRGEILPFGNFTSNGDYSGSDLSREETPKLSIGGTYDYNDDASRARGQLGNFLSETRDLRTVFVDAMFKYRGFSAMAEYANKKAPDGPVVSLKDDGSIKETFTTGTATNVQAGYLFKNNWEVAARYTDYNPTKAISARDEDHYTLGLSKYIVGHSLKVQSDVTLQQRTGSDDRYQFRLQMEIAL